MIYFCNWCSDLQHAMTAKCTCMITGKRCQEKWCPMAETDSDIASRIPVPTFAPNIEKEETCSTDADS